MKHSEEELKEYNDLRNKIIGMLMEEHKITQPKAEFLLESNSQAILIYLNHCSWDIIDITLKYWFAIYTLCSESLKLDTCDGGMVKSKTQGNRSITYRDSSANLITGTLVHTMLPTPFVRMY